MYPELVTRRHDGKVQRSATWKSLPCCSHFSAPASNHAFAAGIPSFNVLPRLSKIAVPTLVIAGRDDWITPPREGAERIHAALPNSEHVISKTAVTFHSLRNK